MAAQAIPETIDLTELYIPDGKVGYSVEAASMPNGDGSFLLTETAGSEDFQAYQDENADHLLGTGACAMSFWIRRNQNFNGSGGLATGLTNSQIPTAATTIMEVADPLGNLLTPASRFHSWSLFSSSSQIVQFCFLGYWVVAAQYYWMAPTSLTLTTGKWHLIVLNRDPAILNGTLGAVGNNGLMQLWMDGNLQWAATEGVWSFYPNPINGPGSQRFGIGDQTTLSRSVGGASAAATVNIAKVCFHNRKLTSADMLDLIDSMKYGGPT